MSTAVPSQAPATPAPEYAVVAGLLSYLVPGLGQVSQGRFGKGLLFFFCIYSLFFIGVRLGTASEVVDNEEYHVGGNVYLPDNAERGNAALRVLGMEIKLPRLFNNLYNRPQFLGQFWVGLAAWPAIWQYLHYDERAEAQLRNQIRDARDAHNKPLAEELEQELHRGDLLFGHFQRTPTEEANNVIQNGGNKLLELAWVYTVIAGVLNIMVIYDALAGPAFPATRRQLPQRRSPDMQPLSNIYWHLPIMIVLISLVYSGTLRFDEWGAILTEAFRWGTRLLGFLAAVVGVLFVVGLCC